jgi:hypothetical protein
VVGEAEGFHDLLGSLSMAVGITACGNVADFFCVPRITFYLLGRHNAQARGHVLAPGDFETYTMRYG